MKKLLALLLALVLVLSLVACAEEEETSIRRSKKDREETTEATEEKTEPEETEEETQEETEEETEPEEEEAEPFGRVDGQVYENAYFGFGVELDRTWVIATEEEAAEMMGIGAEVMGIDEQLVQGTYCDLYALTGTGLAMNIMLEKESLYSRVYSDEDILEDSSEVLVSQFESMGVENLETQLATVTFAGRLCSAVYIQGAVYGVNLYETAVLWREGDYMAFIVVASRETDDCAEVLLQFYSLD